MKKVCKIAFILFILLIIFLRVYNVKASDIWSVSRNFLDTGSKVTGTTDELKKVLGLSDATKSGFEELIDFLWGLGLLVIFISTIVLGIKYMLVLPQEKSRLKQATTPYIIGVVIIFGALTIWKFVIILLDGSL